MLQNGIRQRIEPMAKRLVEARGDEEHKITHISNRALRELERLFKAW